MQRAHPLSAVLAVAGVLASACAAPPPETAANALALAIGPAGAAAARAIEAPAQRQQRRVRIVAAPPAARVSISAPQYDAPGATVPAIATVSGQRRHSDVRFTMRGSDGASADCSGRTWRNPHDGTISQTCLLTLPRRRAAVSIAAHATVTRGHHRYRVQGAASRAIVALGPRTSPLSRAEITEVARCGNTSGKVWLTFDDGTRPALLTSILSALRRKRVQAIFLWTGTFARAYPGLVRRVVRAGHLLGNHSDTHVPMSDRPRVAVRREIRRGVAATTTPRVMRPPFAAGAFSRRLVRLAAAQGYTVCRWSADSADWSPTLSSPAHIVRRVRFGDRLSPPLRRGGVLLMHSTVPATAAALPRIIDVIRHKGSPLPTLPRRR